MNYENVIIRTKTPFDDMVNYLNKNIKKYLSIHIYPYFDFQIRFTKDDYLALPIEYKTTLEKYSKEHSMAPCHHYVYNYRAEKAFTLYKNKKRIIFDKYYESDCIGEIVFFNPNEFPKLISDNIEKQHNDEFVITQEG